MSLFEIILTLALSWGMVLWGHGHLPPEGHLLSGRVEHHAQGTKRRPATGRPCVTCWAGAWSFCGVGVFLLLYGSFNDSDRILCAGLGLIGVMVLLSILVPKLNPKKYRK